MGASLSLPRRNVVISRRHAKQHTTGTVALLGLAGQRGVGKDSFADALDRAFCMYQSSASRHAFADGIKDLTCALFGVTRQFIEHWKHVEANPPRLNVPMRKILQDIGEQMRTIQPDVWVNTLRAQLSGDSVITDVRHDNEIDAIVKWGGKIILIVRGTPNDDMHVSETTLKSASAWCLDRMKPTLQSVVNMNHVQITPDAPALIHRVNYVVFNIGTVETLDQLAMDLLESIVNEQNLDCDSDDMGALNI